MENLKVITHTWGSNGESFIVDCRDEIVQMLITEPLEDGIGPEFKELLPEDIQKILQDYSTERKFTYLKPSSDDDWYIAKLIY
ncbi:hypothetical protein [Pedobacter panaciterrae]|uniref:hypothetical protein n=1 Tax=Pedobacter panaciterrae TaxID=363849 RepID=UPI0025921B7B|nr:hypothetical protein [uncultured Pedobacter sp.]